MKEGRTSCWRETTPLDVYVTTRRSEQRTCLRQMPREVSVCWQAAHVGQLWIPASFLCQQQEHAHVASKSKEERAL